MSHRLWILGCITVAIASAGGCDRKSGDSASGARDGARTGSRAELPSFADATWDHFQEALGDQYQITGDDRQRVLEWTSAPFAVRMIVRCQPRGAINYVNAEVTCPRDVAAEQVQQVCGDLLLQMAGALRLPTTDAFSAKTQIGLILAEANQLYSFYNGLSLFTVRPDADPPAAGGGGSGPQGPPGKKGGKAPRKPSAEAPGGAAKTSEPGPATDATAAAEPAAGQRRAARPPVRRMILQVTPTTRLEPLPYQPLPGSSTAQLEQLLEGFKAIVRVGTEEVMYHRQAEDHLEIVHCKTDDAGHICWLQAMVLDPPRGADRETMNMPLWLKLAELQYDENDPEKVQQYLRGDKFVYDGGVGQQFGPATFLVRQIDGQLGQLQVWGDMRRPALPTDSK